MIFSVQAKNLYVPTPRDHVKDPKYSPDPIKAEQHYFRLMLAEMSLTHDRAWFATWYPAVHSLVSFKFGGKTIDVPYIAGSLALKDINVDNLGKVIQMNHPLTSLMPFNGGDIDIFAGLLAMQGENYLDRLINVLSGFSNLLAVPQLSAAINVAAPLVHGVQELLGIHQLFNKDSGNLRPGYTAILLAQDDPAKQVKPQELWVVDDQLHKGSSLDTCQELKGHTYMLLRIDAPEDRDDWEELMAIQEPYQKAVEALINDNKPQEADAYLRKAVTTALFSPDLTRAHRSAVARRLIEQFDEVRNLGLGAVKSDYTNLNIVMQAALPAATALMLGEPDLEALFT